MRQVTAILIQSGNIDRANLYLDGEFCCGISRMVLASNNVKVGTMLSESELQELIFESEKDKAFNWTLSYISRYTPTSKGLKSKLYDKGYNKPIVEYCLSKATEYGYINDLEWAKCYVEYNKIVKGANRIKNELAAKGISKEIISQVVKDIDDDEDTIYKVASKHVGNNDLDDPKYVARLARFLHARGWESSEIFAVIDRLKAERKV
ncbi:MAG: regulatory protein RecX [Christensenellales bacterium]